MSLNRRRFIKGALATAAVAAVNPASFVESAAGILLKDTRVWTAEGICSRCEAPLAKLTAYNYVVTNPGQPAVVMCLPCVAADSAPRVYALDRRMTYDPSKWRIRSGSHFDYENGFEKAVAIYTPTGHMFRHSRPVHTMVRDRDDEWSPYYTTKIHYDEPIAIEVASMIPVYAREQGLSL